MLEISMHTENLLLVWGTLQLALFEVPTMVHDCFNKGVWETYSIFHY